MSSERNHFIRDEVKDEVLSKLGENRDPVSHEELENSLSDYSKEQIQDTVRKLVDRKQVTITETRKLKLK